MIYIISGPVQSGKTTRLTQWVKGRSDVGGFLSPTIDARRFLQRLSIPATIPFEADHVAGYSDIIAVGRFRFYTNAFMTASEWAKADLINPNIRFIIIDEVGKLEMKGQGFAELLNVITRRLPPSKHLILVIRELLLTGTIEKFNLRPNTVMSATDFDLDHSI